MQKNTVCHVYVIFVFIQVHYFNEMFGVWEPLLEPLEIEKSDDFKPWTLGIKVCFQN